MKPKYFFYVTDWNPNGTNALIVRNRKGQQIDFREEALFGVDVNKLGPGKYFETDIDVAEHRISRELIKRHIASSPFADTFNNNCRWLKKYL